MKIAPSILAADLLHLGQALDQCAAGGADVVHVDVMDGRFVPNLSFGIPVVQALAEKTQLPLDVHLMVASPGDLLERYLEAGAAWISVHWEAAVHLDRLVTQIRAGGARAGVALNPQTPVEHLFDLLGQLDFVVLMSVNPGFGGQPFLPYVVDKVRRLRRTIDERGLATLIEIDGGIDRDNIRQVVTAGADVCVAGTSVFRSSPAGGGGDPVAAIADLRRRGQGAEEA